MKTSSMSKDSSSLSKPRFGCHFRCRIVSFKNLIILFWNIWVIYGLWKSWRSSVWFGTYKKQFVIHDPESLNLILGNCFGPKFPENASFISPPDNILKLNVCLLNYFVWLLCQWLPSNSNHRVPSIGIVILSTGSVPERKTIIDHC